MKDSLYIQREVSLKRRQLWVDGQSLFVGRPDTPSADFFTELYRLMGINYLRFFKMDMLSKTLFLASEALWAGSGLSVAEGNEDMAMVFYNGHSSLDADIQFQATLQSGAFFPSPSLFICTLANVALGELAIRHKIMGENITFIAPNFDAAGCVDHVTALFSAGGCGRALCGWFDFADHQEEADIFLISKEKTNKIFNIHNITWKNSL